MTRYTVYILPDEFRRIKRLCWAMMGEPRLRHGEVLSTQERRVGRGARRLTARELRAHRPGVRVPRLERCAV